MDMMKMERYLATERYDYCFRKDTTIASEYTA